MTWGGYETLQILVIIGSDNGLPASCHQAITGTIAGANGVSDSSSTPATWTNADVLSIEPLGTNLSEIVIKT